MHVRALTSVNDEMQTHRQNTTRKNDTANSSIEVMKRTIFLSPFKYKGYEKKASYIHSFTPILAGIVKIQMNKNRYQSTRLNPNKSLQMVNL